jgi:hypothetical protein
MDNAERCRTQAEKCRRLLLLAESGAEATILTSLSRSWDMIANQTDRYVAIMKKEAAQKSKAASVGGLFHLCRYGRPAPPRGGLKSSRPLYPDHRTAALAMPRGPGNEQPRTGRPHRPGGMPASPRYGGLLRDTLERCPLSRAGPALAKAVASISA